MVEDKSVCAVIVTFNRKELLKRCIDHILLQTYKVKKLIVIDNHSSDGSKQYISHTLGDFIASFGIEFCWKRLDENLGGAGGFSKGVEEFMHSECDLIWLMDDDGFPDFNCLNLLVKAAKDNAFIGPIVLSESDKESLSFPVRISSSLKVIDKLADLGTDWKKCVLKGVVLPFNGTLISRQVVESVGLPEPKYFIWGDEVDYTERARRTGADISTICAALYFHPKVDNLGRSMFFGLLRFNDPSNELKLYCYCRNNFVNKKKYNGILYAIMFACKAFWYCCFTRPSLENFKIALLATIHGIKGDFSKHTIFLEKRR